MNGRSNRDIWLSLAIVMPLAAVGLFLLRHDPTAKGFLMIAAIFSGVILRQSIERRELRRRGIVLPRPRWRR